MKIRRLLAAVALLLTAALLCACAGGNPGGATPAPGGDTPAPELVSPTPTPMPTPEPTPTPSPAEQLLAGMTAEEKVWQLFILHPSQLTETGTLLTDAQGVAEILPAGGIILDSTNLESEAQTLALIADLQALSEIPLLVSVDEEGGTVARVGPALGMTTLNSMFHYRAEGTDRARENARALAEGLASLGFNVDFAPVADVWTNPANTVIGARAYSDDPQQAASRVIAGNTTAMTAVAEMSWEMMLIKVPVAERRETVIPAPSPYSRRMMPTSVAQPVWRSGLAYTSARIRQAIPAPSVNHQADMP